MTSINVTVCGAQAWAEKTGRLTTHMVGVPVAFTFDSGWENLNKFAVFRCGNTVRDRALLHDNATTVPHEVLCCPGEHLMVGVEGRKEDGTLVIPTTWADAGVVIDGANATGIFGEKPTPNAYDDIMAAIRTSGIRGSQGPKGEKGDKGQDGRGVAVINTVLGESIDVADASDFELRGFTIYGKTVQDGIPTPDAPIELIIPCDNGSISVTVTDGTQNNVQVLQVSTPNGLPSVPVKSGGNYTDANGQQWLRDEIDFAKGVYIQRVGKVVFNGTENWSTYGSSGVAFSYNQLKNAVDPGYSAAPDMICTHCVACGRNMIGKQIGVSVSGATYLLIELSGIITSVALLKSFLAEQYAKGTPLTVLYKTSTETEIPLSAEELAAYAALHTNKPNTVVSNSGNAPMELSYVADTKAYIENKLAWLKKVTTYNGDVEVK